MVSSVNGGVEVLDRKIMGVREAARQLRIPPSTLIYWLEGGQRQGTWYQPVLRPEPTGSREITWGEMVEARYLRAYRQQSVSMQQLRPFIAGLRQEFGVPYPLAHFKPFIGAGRKLLLEIQENVGLPESLWVVYEVKTGQLILDARATDYLERVEFADTGEQEAERLYPAGRGSPVTMDPRISSAAATVRGIRTEAIAELADADVPVDQIANDFGLPVNTVKAALAYEWAEAA
jgi:uncharacterized protein (DUF433 family)